MLLKDCPCREYERQLCREHFIQVGGSLAKDTVDDLAKLSNMFHGTSTMATTVHLAISLIDFAFRIYSGILPD